MITLPGRISYVCGRCTTRYRLRLTVCGRCGCPDMNPEEALVPKITKLHGPSDASVLEPSNETGTVETDRPASDLPAVPIGEPGGPVEIVPVPPVEDEPPAPEPPGPDARKADWVAYAQALGVDSTGTIAELQKATGAA